MLSTPRCQMLGGAMQLSSTLKPLVSTIASLVDLVLLITWNFAGNSV